MSAIFTPGQGAVFFTETSARSSALAGVFPTETLVLGGPPDLIGDLFIPSITFAGALSLANYKLVTAFSPNINRSNATGQYGYVFELIAPIRTFNRLGVLAGGTNTGICTINLYTLADHASKPRGLSISPARSMANGSTSTSRRSRCLPDQFSS